MLLCDLLSVVPMARAEVQRPTVCVVVPHFKDEYWLSVGYGLEQEAHAREVALLIYESGGYHAVERQVELLHTCVARGAKAILFGAVSADDPMLLKAVAEVSGRLPVLALVNEFHSADLSGAIGVDWRDMGRAVGMFLAERHPAGSLPVRIGFVTGPRESGWSPLLEAGLDEGLARSAAEVVVTRHADSGLREQLREVEEVLRTQPLDYLLGTAPAIEGAMGLAARTDGAFPKLIASYVSHSVLRGLRNGTVIAVPYDDPVLQGRLGVRMAIAAISGQALSELDAPGIEMIVPGNADRISLSPAGLRLLLE